MHLATQDAHLLNLYLFIKRLCNTIEALTNNLIIDGRVVIIDAQSFSMTCTFLRVEVSDVGRSIPQH